MDDGGMRIDGGEANRRGSSGGGGGEALVLGMVKK